MMYTGDIDASSSCALLWKSIFDMLSSLLQSAAQDAYIALTSPLVDHWNHVSGMIQPYCSSCCCSRSRSISISNCNWTLLSGMIQPYFLAMIRLFCFGYDSATVFCWV